MPADFIDLIAWQQGLQLVADTVRISSAIRGVNAIGLRTQIVSASESIPANIAEGYGRGKGPDCMRFMRIAIASAAEVESHLRVAVVSERLAAELAAPVIERARRTRALTTGLLRSMSR